MRGKWRLTFQVGFTYIGTVIGAGFASGQEMLQFFSVYGKYSYLGIMISTFFFAWLGVRMMVIGARLGADSYQEFNRFLFGKRLGEWMNHLVTIMLFGVTVAMLAGTGALFEEQLGLSFHLGVWLSIIFAYWFNLRGLDGILSVNTFVVPFMLGFMLFVVWMGLQQGEVGPLWEKLPIRAEPHWLIATISYIAFNLVLSQSVLVPLGASIRDEVILRWGGWIGAIGLGIMMLIGNMVIQWHLEEVLLAKIPMGWVIAEIGKGIQLLFLLLVWGEILTTLIGDVYGLAASLRKWVSIRTTWLITGIFLLAYLLSFVGFSNLVRYLYPLFGYCGLGMVFLLVVRRMPSY
ncbi:hypothetical protein [Thermoflavimicrobium daqui]|uniref:Membrane protein YkvI n=1 Tax=Thermoflavimicrobium daqui TaxID=2137476 RepID=A0A364K1E5_9BACL|nr:hypothetical protein [Thermoflavimicrobium daqui]RAL21846.1 hypothetical protein DL897_15630 [Thermoflavimicrobium daqui]